MEPRSVTDLVAALNGGLIVSCHKDPETQSDGQEILLSYVRAAEMGGAAGLRVQGHDEVRTVRRATQLPIIGFMKGSYNDGSELITESYEIIDKLFDAGADIVAIDATKRKRPDGDDGFIFFEKARKKYSRPLWADIATFREGVRAAEIGADFVATTLAGYTHGTVVQDYHTPDYALIDELSTSLTIPVAAEGRIWTPEAASRALSLGASAVVVGTAITRPRVVTQMFVDALKKS